MYNDVMVAVLSQVKMTSFRSKVSSEPSVTQTKEGEERQMKGIVELKFYARLGTREPGAVKKPVWEILRSGLHSSRSNFFLGFG